MRAPVGMKELQVSMYIHPYVSVCMFTCVSLSVCHVYLSEYVFMCVHVCMGLCACARVHVCGCACLCTYVWGARACTHVCVCRRGTCVRVRVCGCVCLCVCPCLWVCLPVHVSVSGCVFVGTYVCILAEVLNSQREDQIKSSWHTGCSLALKDGINSPARSYVGPHGIISWV